MTRQRRIPGLVSALLVIGFLVGCGAPRPLLPTPTNLPVAEVSPTAVAGAPAPAAPTAALVPLPPAVAPVPTSHPASVPSPTVATPSPTVEPSKLQNAFTMAAKEYGVPEVILLSVGYNESRWEQHAGQPSAEGGYGIMHLTDLPNADTASAHTLQAAAKLLGASPDTLKTDPVQNIRGGAALLAQYAKDTVGKVPTNDTGAWYGAIAKYRGSSVIGVDFSFADDVYKTILAGQSLVTSSGDLVVLPPTIAVPNLRSADALYLHQPSSQPAECPASISCTFVPAAAGNYNPNGGPIRYIVIHDTESSFTSAITTFQDPKHVTSANYIVRGDGQVVQMVPDGATAYHAGNYFVNGHSIGIEHEGYAVHGATWYSETLYETSAKLVRYLAAKYHVPLDRAHIIGHDNVPGYNPASLPEMHWDPGPFWDWNHYMDLLGAPLKPSANPTARVVMIDPTFATNDQMVTPLCDPNHPEQPCPDFVPLQPSNFVPLHTAPSPEAPLLADPSLQKLEAVTGYGTTQINDWGDTAVTGQKFYLAETRGDWSAIYFSGQEAWFYNPKGTNTVPASGTLVTPRPGLAAIPVYGVVGNGAALPYQITAGQVYVVGDQIGDSYQIFFNHRLGYVKAADVTVLP